jgi:hypothetical protein
MVRQSGGSCAAFAACQQTAKTIAQSVGRKSESFGAQEPQSQLSEICRHKRNHLARFFIARP